MANGTTKAWGMYCSWERRNRRIRTAECGAASGSAAC